MKGQQAMRSPIPQIFYLNRGSNEKIKVNNVNYCANKLEKFIKINVNVPGVKMTPYGKVYWFSVGRILDGFFQCN